MSQEKRQASHSRIKQYFVVSPNKNFLV